jgi:hypothetical protein
VSADHERWRKPEYQVEPGHPAAGDEPATGADIVEQGSDRPPARWRSAVRWRRPPTVAIVLGVTGLIVGLGAGYAAGALHAGARTAPPAVSGTTTIPPVVFEQGPSSAVIPRGQSVLECSARPPVRQSQPGTPGPIVSRTSVVGGKAIIVRLPSGSHVKLKGCKTTRS